LTAAEWMQSKLIKLAYTETGSAIRDCRHCEEISASCIAKASDFKSACLSQRDSVGDFCHRASLLTGKLQPLALGRENHCKT